MTIADADREALEAERDFLLRSLEDLEAEHAAGELGADEYHRLVDEYTARAAATLRALGGDAAPPSGTPRRRARTTAVVVGLVVVAAAAGVLLASSLGLRQPGQTVTGNAQSGGSRAAFERAVERRPDDVAARMQLARFLLQSGEPVDALKQYDRAAELDPGNVEALAYGGWIISLAGLPDEALKRLDAAVAADARYPDAHVFRGMVLYRGLGDLAGAAAELRTYLELAPDGPMRDQVEALLEEIKAAGTADP
ncbi:MAG: tetratricopeptide repeat protein [Acidimicrobiia bacterium]